MCAHVGVMVIDMRITDRQGDVQYTRVQKLNLFLAGKKKKKCSVVVFFFSSELKSNMIYH